MLQKQKSKYLLLPSSKILKIGRFLSEQHALEKIQLILGHSVSGNSCQVRNIRHFTPTSLKVMSSLLSQICIVLQRYVVLDNFQSNNEKFGFFYFSIKWSSFKVLLHKCHNWSIHCHLAPNLCIKFFVFYEILSNTLHLNWIQVVLRLLRAYSS